MSHERASVVWETSAESSPIELAGRMQIAFQASLLLTLMSQNVCEAHFAAFSLRRNKRVDVACWLVNRNDINFNAKDFSFPPRRAPPRDSGFVVAFTTIRVRAGNSLSLS